MPSVQARNFPSLCRQWRRFRKLSQLDLALAADVSQRHVSWLETGRSKPSREMVLRLSDAMEIPLRERNLLLRAAGYAPVYGESGLDEPAMQPVLKALKRILDHHEPLPAVVVDRLWNVRMQNRAAERLLGAGGEPGAMPEEVAVDDALNLALLTVHPQGLRRFIVNWDEVMPSFVRRLRNEAMATDDPEVQRWFSRLLELAGPIPDGGPVMESLLPVLPLELNIDGLELSLFSVMSTFGTPQDVTTDELRIEAFYPTDGKTADFFTRVAS
jgi:transcriptional regulator with XRE-family HTH domain